MLFSYQVFNQVLCLYFLLCNLFFFLYVPIIFFRFLEFGFIFEVYSSYLSIHHIVTILIRVMPYLFYFLVRIDLHSFSIFIDILFDFLCYEIFIIGLVFSFGRTFILLHFSIKRIIVFPYFLAMTNCQRILR